MKQDDFCEIHCTNCQVLIGYSEIFVNDVIESPKEHHIKGSENIKKAHILCEDCHRKLKA